MRALRMLKWPCIAFVACVTAWAFAYGPLFPWSPVKPGYTSFALDKADVYFANGTTVAPAYMDIDQFIKAAETFHKLSMPHRIAVVACASWDDFFRFSPLTRSHAVAGATLETGTVIYISPKIAEKHLEYGEFLRHEISHAIVGQNVSIFRQMKLKHYAWLYEGVPVWFGQQRAFLTQDEFLARARKTDLVPLFETNAETKEAARTDMRFAYIAWRDFLDYLAQQRGKDTFDWFFRDVQAAPVRMERIFEQTYGRPLPDMVREFEKAIRLGIYQPQ